jgi:hypothetical protein
MALKDAPKIEVLQFDEKEAYDEDRPISGLIRTQLLHLHQAENLNLPQKYQTGTNINDLLTEGQAGKYIQKVTALLHRNGRAAKRRAAAGNNSKRKTGRKGAR